MSKWIYSITVVLVGAGFVWPLWPLCVVGVVFASVMGRWVFAALVGLVLDVAWGPPVGLLHYVYAPFMLVALAAALGRYFLADYFLDRSPTDTL